MSDAGKIIPCTIHPINITTFLVYGYDKPQAIKDGRASVTLTGTRAKGTLFVSMIEKAEVNRR